MGGWKRSVDFKTGKWRRLGEFYGPEFAEEQTDGDGDAWLVNTVEASAAEPEMKTVTVNGQQLAMVVDTGSPVSLVSAETARQLGLLQLLDPCDLRLTSFTVDVR
ncbi:hypothetical protein FJT64_012973 [Amphibalanus amphitrite]|uniref:Peptidase A2 domain-containing protein n=1 Tax=Amphibalanus amphitrite TaxID=1232801 RepID=A0A6A4UY04_AMPAM|nr:hypothetical protein FJT64_012973 [Amphibalanus amphitrite]